jgi:signal peptidase
MEKKLKVFMIFKRVFDIAIVCILALYISTVLIQRVSGNKSVLGYRMFNVASESMVPVYKINDIIAVKDCDPNTLKVGDDIAYIGMDNSLEGKIITHRIINISDDNGAREITTKGVNNDLTDPSITTKQVVGKVVGVVPFISSINKIVMTQAGFYFLIFVPVVLIACMEIAETIIEGKIERKELIEIKD